ncbi:MAG TPA: Ger(x)C family spore germination protein [Ruminiclostridium sp.]|nr:Ger(x)C family spore germination protein [Ruminiclostridium sp.]
MIKRIIAVILLLTFSAILLTGCWDRKELNQLGIAMAIGLDKTEEGRIELTSEIVRPSAMGKQGGGNEPPYELVVSSGDTIFEAIRHTVKEFDRRSFFSHVKVIVIGEDLAREGLEETMDFITRSHELRKTTWLTVASGCKASDILGVKHGLEKIQANYMDGILKSQKIDSSSAVGKVIDFIKTMPGEGINPVTGVFKIIDVKSVPSQGTEPTESKGLKLTGSALFVKDKLSGFLDTFETLGLNIITGKCKRVTIDVQTSPNDKIAIELKRIRCDIVPIISKGKVSFRIVVKAEGSLTEAKDGMDITDQQVFKKINNAFADHIRASTNNSLTKIQKEMKTDVLGLGRALEMKYPKYWNKVKPQWNEIFPDVSFNVDVGTHLNRTGLSQKQLNVKKTGK